MKPLKSAALLMIFSCAFSVSAGKFDSVDRTSFYALIAVMFNAGVRVLLDGETHEEVPNLGAENNCFFQALNDAGINLASRADAIDRLLVAIESPAHRNVLAADLVDALMVGEFRIPLEIPGLAETANPDLLNLRNRFWAYEGLHTEENRRALLEAAEAPAVLRHYLLNYLGAPMDAHGFVPMAFNPERPGALNILAELYGFRLRIVQIDSAGNSTIVLRESDGSSGRLVILRHQGEGLGHFTYLRPADLYLVAGSARGPTSSYSPLYEGFLGGRDTVDLSHRQTYSGKAVTIDIVTSQRPELAHFHGDVRTFDFGPYSIKAAYLERLPTSISGVGISPTEGFTNQAILNIARAMDRGATMEIEWQPYSTLMGLDFATAEQMRGINPFNGIADTNTAIQGTRLAIGLKDIPFAHFSPEGRQQLVAYSERVLELIEFFQANGLGSREEITTRLFHEIEIFVALLQRTPGLGFLTVDPAHSFAEFENGFRFFTVLPPRRGLSAGDVIALESKTGEITGRLYDAITFFQQSFFNFLIANVAVTQNRNHVIAFMESAGFEQVTVERIQSPHNYRKNVWIVRGIKR